MSDALRRELMLFGIDVVIVQPGAVVTAIYDKGEQADMSEFESTPYWDVLRKFQSFLLAEGRKGLAPERLGKAVYQALTTAKPKARYAIVPQAFKNWTLPKLLPSRMLDAAMAKQLGFSRR